MSDRRWDQGYRKRSRVEREYDEKRRKTASHEPGKKRNSRHIGTEDNLLEGSRSWGSEYQNDEVDVVENKVKADFGLSGALNEDALTGNVYNGVVLKWSEPSDAATPCGRTSWHLSVFAEADDGDSQALNDGLMDMYSLGKQSAYLIGRDKKVADIVLNQKSVSKQHAVIQFRLKEKDGKSYIRPYILDLNSTNGTIVNGDIVESSRYIELLNKDILRFGETKIDFVLLKTRNTDTQGLS